MPPHSFPNAPLPHLRLHLAALLIAILLASACALDLRPESKAEPEVPAPGIGAACMQTAGCRTGLACTSGRCQATGDRPMGGDCILSAECASGLHCSYEGKCSPSGTAAEGSACKLEGDCAPGLMCSLDGFASACAKSGSQDLGGACTKTTDCMGGLVCSLNKCESYSTVEPWLGAKCPKTKTGPVKVLFQVPRAGDSSEDFYRLPFPNDIRIKDGKVSLAGHPRPGARYLPFDPVDRYIKAIEEDVVGFGVNQAAYFRFTRAPVEGAITQPGVVQLVNLTPGSPDFGKDVPHDTRVQVGRNFYVCSPSLLVRPKFGMPLRPGETYAVVIERSIKDAEGNAFEPDDDFSAMLAPTPPTGAPQEMFDAYAAYQPLRDWMGDRRIVAATVFTTQKVEDSIIQLRRAARDAAPAPIKNFIRCGSGAKSPCDDGKSGDDHVLGCPASANPAMDQYEGTISIPVYQTGKKPYDNPEDGGQITFDAAGRPQPAGSEDVCFSLSVPKGTMPAGGWPIVVYGHGTGGSYRSAVDNGLAADFATGAVPGGEPIPMATFGYDGVLHGTRRGGSTRKPDDLVYNFLNPRAARDNAVQAGADLFVIARALEVFSQGDLRFDKTKIAVYGHSQGGNATALAAGHEPVFRASVMSGTGGTLIYSLLKKKKPVDVAASMPVVVGDPDVDEHHPVLNLMQMYFERSDPVNFGRRLFLEPLPGATPRHALHIFGTNDNYSPPETQQTYGLAAGFPALAPVVVPYLPSTVMGPLTGNLTISGMKVTAAQAQFVPLATYDGHFVSTQDANARRQLLQMLGTFARDLLPTLGL